MLEFNMLCASPLQQLPSDPALVSYYPRAHWAIGAMLESAEFGALE
jgi:hypothetical protein